MTMPVADIEVDEELVGKLLRAQHPDLAGPLRLAANGWDNVVFRLGDRLSVRLPRRRVAVELLRNEQRWLPQLAGRLRVPIPVPIRIGVPSDIFPWPWSVTAWLPGTPASRIPAADRRPIAADLADFLADLHQPAPSDAPRNPVRGVPLSARTSLMTERLDGGGVPDVERVRALWAELVDTPGWEGPPLWLHGDPHPANLLVDAADGRLAGVIDFGDLTAGDPATDLAAAWMAFDASGREEFHAELVRRDAVDPATWRRARGWALSLGVTLVTSSADNPELAAVGTHTLAQVLG